MPKLARKFNQKSPNDNRIWSKDGKIWAYQYTNMLNKKLRLPSKEIVQIARKGKRIGGDLFDIKVWYDDILENPLMTISISTKIDKRATVRNKIKRKIRAVWADVLKTEKLRKGKYLIIIKNSALAELDNVSIKKAIKLSV